MNLRLLAIGMTAAVALAGCASTSPGYGSSGHPGASTTPRLKNRPVT